MKYPTVSSLCEGIAEAIREKEGSTALINPQDFVDRIKGLEVGGGASESDWGYASTEGGNPDIYRSLVGFSSAVKIKYSHRDYTQISLTSEICLQQGSDFLPDVKACAICLSTPHAGEDGVVETIKEVIDKLNMSFADFVAMFGCSEITKEQFYTLE